jgi:ubiquitin-conjugating enzyme E2 S
MTSIHAPIQPALQAAVKEAKYRGEDPSSTPVDKDEPQNPRPRKQPRLRSNIPKKAVRGVVPPPVVEPTLPTLPENNDQDDAMNDSENESLADSSKENDPSLSPTPIIPAPPSPRKNTLGKRPLSVISTSYPDDPDADVMVIDSDSEEESVQVSPSDRNIAANFIHSRHSPSPQRNPPKLALSKGNAPFRLCDDLQIYEDVPDRTRYNGKENHDSGLLGLKGRPDMQAATLGNSTNPLSSGPNPTLPTPTISSTAKHPSKATKKVGGGARKPAGTKAKPRIGVRRL